MVDYDEENDEAIWAPGPSSTTEDPDAPASTASSPGLPLIVDSPSSQASSSSANYANGAASAPFQPQAPAPAAGPSRLAQRRPNPLRRHDTFVEGPVTGPWMIINSTALGTIIPPALPPVAPAPVVQAPLADHYPSPAPSDGALEEGEERNGGDGGEEDEDEGLEYTDGEDGGNEEGGEYDEEEAEEAW
ncbi:hypothetical protein BKA70DRAFT_1283655 [Coprinopsis sp. MPI-PUGE-AT-0042]|nr:hypothetical protein BKA70DRAFT_1283655 [Coprinopsis sp. MPI-PUGE-AT-0042]